MTVSSGDKTRRLSMGSRWETGIAVILTLVFAVAFGVFYLFYPSFGLVPNELLRPFSWVFLLLSLWMVGTWWRAQGTVFDPYVLFLLAAIVFNGGHILLETLGLNRRGMLRGEFSDRALITTITFVVTGLAVFHAGALTAGLFRTTRSIPALVSRDDTSLLSAMRLVGTVLLIGSVPIWLVEKISDVRTVLSGGYIALYQQSSGSGLDILADFFIPGAIFLLIASKSNSPGRWLGVGIILLNAVVEFFLGSRTNAMWPLLGLVWAYHRAVRPLPRTLLVGGGVFVLFVVFPLVRAFRGITGSARASLDAIFNSYASVDNPVISIISEMGYSMVTVAHTLELVPGTRPYDLGAGYFYALTTVVPNISGGIHPAIARGTAASWLVETVAPATARVGGGLGFSFLAEGYYNFGWIGGLIVLFFIGLLMSIFFVGFSYRGTPFGIAVAAIGLSFLTYFARGESASIIRSLVWYTAIPSVSVAVVASLSRLQMRRSRSRQHNRSRERVRLHGAG